MNHLLMKIGKPLTLSTKASVLADRGFRVLTINEQKEATLNEWQKNATTDLATIEKWAKKNPNGLFGITADTFTVFDFDYSKGHDGLLGQKERRDSGDKSVFEEQPQGLTNFMNAIEGGKEWIESIDPRRFVSSMGGGLHLYMKHIDGLWSKADVGGIQFFDIKTKNDNTGGLGYVVAYEGIIEALQ